MENYILMTAIGVIVTMERMPWLRFERVPFLRPFFSTDMAYFATGVIALGSVLRMQAARWVDGSWLPGLALHEVPFPLVALMATVLYDLGGYCSHRLLHRVDALWKLHKIHHSSRRLDWLATFRAHILEHALRHLISPVSLIVLGFPLPAVAIAAAAYGTWAALGHSNLRLPLEFLEPVFITPRLHRLHHVPNTCQANLGTIFSFWDRLRGTLVTDASSPDGPLGVPGELATYPQTWPRQLVEPLRRPPARR